MPHKHKRKRDLEADCDLPPSQQARSLPVRARSASNSTSAKKLKKHHNKNHDAPRAFRRLMAASQGKKMRPGLDDGVDKTAIADSTVDGNPLQSLQIRPGEDLRSFSVRVDATLPISGLAKKTKIKDGKDEQGFKVHRTLKERKMHKLYDQWRLEERKIQERKEEELEKAAEKELENESGGSMSFASLEDPDRGRGDRRSRGRRAYREEDPWLALKRRRSEAKPGLHDVAQAPPDLLGKRAILGSSSAQDTTTHPDSSTKPAARGREGLQRARQEVVEAYRRIREHEQAKLDAKR